MKNKKIKTRIPLSLRPGRPIGTKSGKKGYDRKSKKRELSKIIKDME